MRSMPGMDAFRSIGGTIGKSSGLTILLFIVYLSPQVSDAFTMGVGSKRRGQLHLDVVRVAKRHLALLDRAAERLPRPDTSAALSTGLTVRYVSDVEYASRDSGLGRDRWPGTDTEVGRGSHVKLAPKPGFPWACLQRFMTACPSVPRFFARPGKPTRYSPVYLPERSRKKLKFQLPPLRRSSRGMAVIDAE